MFRLHKRGDISKISGISMLIDDIMEIEEE